MAQISSALTSVSSVTPELAAGNRASQRSTVNKSTSAAFPSCSQLVGRFQRNGNSGADGLGRDQTALQLANMITCTAVWPRGTSCLTWARAGGFLKRIKCQHFNLIPVNDTHPTQKPEEESNKKGSFSDRLPLSSNLDGVQSWKDVIISCEPFRLSFGISEKETSEPSTSAMGVGTSAPSKVVKTKTPLDVGEALPHDYEKDVPIGVKRRAGILLHPTCLPGPYGIGELGDEAIRFLEWLKAAGCSVWQVLPLVPPGRKSGEDGSPYAGQDANCGNTLLISLDELVKWGLLMKSDLPRGIPVRNADFIAVAKVKDPLVLKAAQKLLTSKGTIREELDKFRADPLITVWLDDAALFAAIDNQINKQFWWDWPAQLRDRDLKALECARQEHRQYIDEFVAQQFLFQRQWNAVHKYAKSKGISIIGDMPIYVGGHSADVWVHRNNFMLDPKTGAPTFVSGVPPDDFSATGQLWGSPLYNWRAMARDNYSWWSMRMKRAFGLYDEFRIDHFRGLAGYWCVKSGETTALNGSWLMGPRLGFFDAIRRSVGKIDIIAEDLGVITKDVVELRRAINAPGMAVLQFAFGNNPQNPHLPQNHEVEQVVYPGTHDNDTTRGWWSNLPEENKNRVKAYLSIDEITEEEIAWELMRMAFASVARTAVIPMQDILCLDSSGRMNVPAVRAGNWSWRVGDSDIFSRLEKEKLRINALLKLYNRLPS